MKKCCKKKNSASVVKQEIKNRDTYGVPIFLRFLNFSLGQYFVDTKKINHNGLMN